MSKSQFPDRIADLAALVAAQIPVIFADGEDKITQAITAIMENAKEHDQDKTILPLTVAIKWDLGGTSVIVSLGVSVKHKFETVTNMDDPKQPALIHREEAE